MDGNLLNYSWVEIANQQKGKFVVFLGIAPIEEHGKHLPIGVDIFETSAWIDLALNLLEQTKPDFYFGKLPIVPLGFANMGGFPGNIHVSREIVFDVVYSLLFNIANWGVKNVVVISGHADPLHTISIEQACEKINSKLGLMAIAPMGSIFNAEQKNIAHKSTSVVEEKRQSFSNDFHAGWVETSSMLAIAPDLVNPNYTDRPDISMDGRDMMNPQKVAALISGEGHIGFPKEATAEIGKELNKNIAEQIHIAVCNFIDRVDYEQYMYHPLYNIPGMQLQR